MTDPQGSFYTNFGRFYAHPKFQLEAVRRSALFGTVATESESPYAPNPSITNIIGMLDKKFLPPYYAKLVAEYAVQNLDSLRYTVEKFGPETAIGQLKAVPNTQGKAAGIGDEVHAWIDAVIKNEPATPLTSITAVRMCEQFTHFLEVARPEIINSEYTVWSYEHGYAGTGDLMWWLDGRLCVVDTKTGTDVHPEVAMQTAAISHADVILDAHGDEHPMPHIDELDVLHVRPRSVKLHRLERTEESFRAFLALKTAFNWVRFDRDYVIQEPFRTEYRKDAE